MASYHFTVGSGPRAAPALAKAAPAGDLIRFFLLAYAVMWACFFTVVAAHIPANSVPGYGLLLLGAFAPAIAALSLTARAEGTTGVRALLSRVTQWRVPVKWYVFAAGYTVAVKLTVALLDRAITGAWPRFGDLPLYIIPIAIAFSTPFQAGEEIGWRGYALPRLA